MTSERQQELRAGAKRYTGQWAAEMKEVLDEIESLQGQLAECYRLSGADPDGNEDWRLAPDAVREVKRLRTESDAQIERLQLQLSNEIQNAATIANDYSNVHNQVARLQRERDALLREHEATERLYRVQNDENFPGESELDMAMQAKQAHDEATRVLAEGAKGASA